VCGQRRRMTAVEGKENPQKTDDHAEEVVLGVCHE
jgi:hypothetical protein